MQKATRKFGKNRYVLLWDSKTFNTSSIKEGIREKKRIAQLYIKDYQARGYLTKVTNTTGNNIKVWGLPR